MFSQMSVCPHFGGGVPHPRSSWWGVPHPADGWGGVPHPRSRWGVLHPTNWGTPSQVQVGGNPHPRLDGVPPPSRTGWGTPPPVRRQSSIASSTCYVTGGMPLALTQEDFLVTPRNILDLKLDLSRPQERTFLYG